MSHEVKISTGEPGANDVVFDCANCGHGLCIDSVASGFKIICPHCNTEQAVPGEQQDFGPEPGDAGDEAELLAIRCQELESLTATQQVRLEQISREMALIQAALDRVVGLLQDAQVEPPPPEFAD